MPDLSNIKNIIFDLGNVVLNLDFDASIKAFQQLGLNEAEISPSVAFSDPVFYLLETGRITPAEFRTRVRELLNNPNASDQQIDDAWYAMILDIPEKRVKALQDLRSKYRIFLFSNTNEIHIGRLLEEFKAIYGFDFQGLFDEVFYSHELQARKPEIHAFQKVIELTGVEPGETLFVDDLKNNILAAEKAGLQTLWLKAGMEMAELF